MLVVEVFMDGGWQWAGWVDDTEEGRESVGGNEATGKCRPFAPQDMTEYPYRVRPCVVPLS
jgi:hypothetical protein